MPGRCGGVDDRVAVAEAHHVGVVLSQCAEGAAGLGAVDVERAEDELPSTRAAMSPVNSTPA